MQPYTLDYSNLDHFFVKSLWCSLFCKGFKFLTDVFQLFSLINFFISASIACYKGWNKAKSNTLKFKGLYMPIFFYLIVVSTSFSKTG